MPGPPEQAAIQLDQASGDARLTGPFALAYGLSVAVRLFIILRDDDSLREHPMRLVALSVEGGFCQFQNRGLCALGWLEARVTGARQGL